jgi:hypothetical protein
VLKRVKVRRGRVAANNEAVHVDAVQKQKNLSTPTHKQVFARIFPSRNVCARFPLVTQRQPAPRAIFRAGRYSSSHVRPWCRH